MAAGVARLAKMMKDDAPSPRARILEDLGGGFHRLCQFEHEITGGAGWNESDKERRIREGEGETKNPCAWWMEPDGKWMAGLVGGGSIIVIPRSRIPMIC